MKFLALAIQKLHTEQTHRQTDPTEIITYLHTRMVMIYHLSYTIIACDSETFKILTKKISTEASVSSELQEKPGRIWNLFLIFHVFYIYFLNFSS